MLLPLPSEFRQARKDQQLVSKRLIEEDEEEDEGAMDTEDSKLWKDQVPLDKTRDRSTFSTILVSMDFISRNKYQCWNKFYIKVGSHGEDVWSDGLLKLHPEWL